MHHLLKLKMAFKIEPSLAKLNDYWLRNSAVTTTTNEDLPNHPSFAYQSCVLHELAYNSVNLSHWITVRTSCHWPIKGTPYRRATGCRICGTSEAVTPGQGSSRCVRSISNSSVYFRCLRTSEDEIVNVFTPSPTLRPSFHVRFVSRPRPSANRPVGIHRCKWTLRRAPSSAVRSPHRRTFSTAARACVRFQSAEETHSPTLSEMKRRLQSAGLEFKVGYACLTGKCMFCSGPKTAARRFYVNMITGHCICQCAETCAPWPQAYDSMVNAGKRRSQHPTATPPAATGRGHRSERVNKLWDEAVELAGFSEAAVDQLRLAAGLKYITTETLRSFNVRFSRARKALVMPLYGHDGILQGVKVREVTKVKGQQEVVETLYSRHDQCGLFGFSLLPPGDEEIVLVPNPQDALAVRQSTGKAALSLANGIAALPQETLPLLEQFKKITVWFGNDLRSWQSAKQFARKLNTSRCHFIRPVEKHPSPFVALEQGLNLGDILETATPISHKSIVSFRSLREDVFGELSHAEQVAGVKWRRFPVLNKLLKGHRRGELSVFTGPTGSGKTTFMAEYSLDLCTQGVNTLWGSFEIQNTRLAKVMLTQYARISLEKNPDQFDKFADRFELLPLYFMTFHGQQTLKAVLEAMGHAVYVHDIEHIIIDNLQFMVGYSDKQFMLERFAMYDHIIAAFRRFATTSNCHVTVVIHPRKENASEELQTASIFGSAKASQEADNILILQDRRLTDIRGRKYIQIAKNRFDGDLGIMPLYFNKESLTMSPPPKNHHKKNREGGKV